MGNLDVSNGIKIDSLEYHYQSNIPNQLKSVIDYTSHPEGFKGTAATLQYQYDANGNLIRDDNKSILISYNHLNLPVTITFGNGDIIGYLYDATGTKLRKKVNSPNVILETDYLGGHQYLNERLQFFPTTEGYVRLVKGTGDIASYAYVFNYVDHLGNIRVSYGKEGRDSAPKIIEENHYYPFGLKHKNYNVEKYKHELDEELIVLNPMNPNPPMVINTTQGYNYKYNGKELQDELGLNVYDYGARNYDPAIGRWMNIDPLAENSRRWTLYNYAYNNPIFFIDPDGMQAYPPTEEEFANIGVDMTKIPNGEIWTDEDGSWAYNTSNQTWEGINGTDVNIPAKTQQLEEVLITNENWAERNLVFKAQIKGSVGGQIGVKAGVAKLEGGLFTTDLGAAEFDFISMSGDTKGPDGQLHNFAGASAGFGEGKNQLSVGAKYDYSFGLNEQGNATAGTSSWTASLGKSFGPGVKNGFEGLGVRPGAKANSSSDCYCLDVGAAAKLILGVEVKFVIGIKK